VGVSPAGDGRVAALHLAYADPPYPGLSKRYYGDHEDYAGEVDHEELIRLLSTFDGWALSTSSRALPDILRLCPPGVRVAAWHRGERPTRSLGPQSAWEPVIYSGGRLAIGRDTTRSTVVQDDASAIDARRVLERDATRNGAAEHDAFEIPTRRLDSLVHHSRPRLTDLARVVGAKPAVFCRWMFDLLGAEAQDDFTDIFPGSGGVMRAWEVYAGK
jgi:hypothetical protein